MYNYNHNYDNKEDNKTSYRIGKFACGFAFLFVTFMIMHITFWDSANVAFNNIENGVITDPTTVKSLSLFGANMEVEQEQEGKSILFEDSDFVVICPDWVVLLMGASFIYWLTKKTDKSNRSFMSFSFVRTVGYIIYMALALWVGIMFFDNDKGELINVNSTEAAISQLPTLVSEGMRIIDVIIADLTNFSHTIMMHLYDGSVLIISLLILWVYLDLMGVGIVRITLSVVLGGLVTGLIFLPFGYDVLDMHTWYHLITGGLTFGVLFMTVSPVTADQTIRGQWIYGFIVGFIAVMMRLMNPGLPTEMITVILFLTPMIPLVDYVLLKINGNLRLKHDALTLKYAIKEDDDAE